MTAARDSAGAASGMLGGLEKWIKPKVELIQTVTTTPNAKAMTLPPRIKVAGRMHVARSSCPAQGTLTENWPGMFTLMMPAQRQLSMQLLSSAGAPPISTVGAPGVQGAGVAGKQGIGVSTPRAAAVAAVTVGFAMEEHVPNGKTFSSGALSIMVAAGAPPAITRPRGRTCKVAGAEPKLH
jgi:hypothetical protein